MSSQQAYPVSRLPLPGSEEATQMTAGSGRQLSMLLDSSTPLGAFSKILLESPRYANSEEFCHVWRVWDTRLECSAFRLTPLEPNTAENESSLWATPQAHDAHQGNAKRVGRFGTKHGGRNLADEVMTPKLWPTPTVPNGGRRNPEGTSITGQTPDGKKRQIDLREFAIRLYATPVASQKETLADWEQRQAIAHSTYEHRPKYKDCSQGSLNPRFVEQLMGFPIDHTALSPSATRSFRSRRSRSSKRSGK